MAYIYRQHPIKKELELVGALFLAFFARRGDRPQVQDSEEWSESTTSAHLRTSISGVGGSL